MNQKDYKEIAEIIKKELSSHKMTVPQNTVINVCNQLADYFEEEELKRYYYENDIDMHGMEKEDYQMLNFNKQQFLKDCGVE